MTDELMRETARRMFAASNYGRARREADAARAAPEVSDPARAPSVPKQGTDVTRPSRDPMRDTTTALFGSNP